jgi:lipopolysaccharide/colanic/teichoic acid biosynthesis glycosyltransferase
MGSPVSKRAFDVVGSMLGLLAIAPLAPVIALAIKAESRGPVFVKLDRVSGGRVVKVWKFRSMHEGANSMKPKLAYLNERSDGPFFKIRRDPRVTRVGKLIRKFRLDEFPQLMNVLRGELSLVGPRPHEPGEVRGYPPSYRHIPEAKAGVTGLSQVSGASSLPFLRELELDDYYVKNQSLSLDLRITAKTLGIIFFDPTAV